MFLFSMLVIGGMKKKLLRCKEFLLMLQLEFVRLQLLVIQLMYNF